MLLRLVLAPIVALTLFACRDKQLDLQRATLARQLAQEEAGAAAAAARCKSLAETPVTLTSPLEERKRELEAKEKPSLYELQERVMLSELFRRKLSEVGADIEKCIADEKDLTVRAAETKAKIADIDKLQPPET